MHDHSAVTIPLPSAFRHLPVPKSSLSDMGLEKLVDIVTARRQFFDNRKHAIKSFPVRWADISTLLAYMESDN